MTSGGNSHVVYQRVERNIMIGWTQSRHVLRIELVKKGVKGE